MCNFCINLDQIPTVILDQVPWGNLDQSTVDRVECPLHIRRYYVECVLNPPQPRLGIEYLSIGIGKEIQSWLV